MAHIRQLDAHVADLIAAGEVVERPASVVKELMENAIDAGALAVTVEIQNGGMSLIRVTDNGSGILPEEARTAFLRHATSKLRTKEDLEAIGTLGFRGEALAAISAVSRMEMLSCVPGASLGVSIILEGGVVRSQEDTGCPIGTTMVVRDLFFNTPARFKFMKRDAAEGAAVFAQVQRIALAHPEVSVKFLRDGKQELLTPGDGKLGSVLYSVFGRDIAAGFTSVNGSGEEVSVQGVVSMPAYCRGTRGYQHFILNGRPIKSRLLTAAVEEAYANQKMVGKFPGCVLQIEIKPSAVDVNVHPAKTEVKFLSDKKVFDGVYYAVLSALGAERRHPFLHLGQTALQPEGSAPATPAGTAFQSISTQQFRDSMSGPAIASAPAARAAPSGVARTESRAPLQWPQAGNPAPHPVEESPSAPSREEAEESVQLRFAQLDAPQDAAVPQKPAPVPVIQEAAEEIPWRLAGEVLSTYIVAEQGDTVYLIDKHAAHERMNFDRMKAGEYRPMAQTLLEPLVITPTPEEGGALLGHLPLLEDFGFLVEDFGGGSLVVRQIPFDLSPGEAEATMGEIAAGLLAGTRADPAAARDSLLHTMACKAAIKGGQKNEPEELEAVALAVLSGQVKYCPHGRPVAITLTKAQLERQFGRA